MKFAQRGEIVIRLVDEPGRRGVTVVARDAGPGIAISPRRCGTASAPTAASVSGCPAPAGLMDEFDIVSEVGKGTTVTMAKWR